MKILKTEAITQIVDKVTNGTGDTYHDIQFICRDGSVSFFSSLLVHQSSSLLSSIISQVPCCVRNDPIVVYLDGFGEATVQAFVQCVSTGVSRNLTQRQVEEVVKLGEILRMNLQLEKLPEAPGQIKVKEEKIDHYQPLQLTRQEIEMEHNRLMKKVMENIDTFNRGATSVPCSECEKSLSFEILIHHYKEHIDSLESRKMEWNRPREIVDEGPKPKKPRGRPRKSAEEKKVVKVALSSKRRRSSSSEKEFKCANPTFKVKAGEKKVRKKREKKVKMTPKLNQMLMQEEVRRNERAKASPLLLGQQLLDTTSAQASARADVVPDIKLSFDLSADGAGAKEINLKELSSKKRGRKRKGESIIKSDLPRVEERERPTVTSVNRVADLKPIPSLGVVKESVRRQLASMNTRISFPEYLKNVCRQANKTEGLVSGSNEEIEKIKDNHKVLEKVVRESIDSSMEKKQPDTSEKIANTFINGEDVLNESSDCDNLVMDLSDEERL